MLQTSYDHNEQLRALGQQRKGGAQAINISFRPEINQGEKLGQTSVVPPFNDVDSVEISLRNDRSAAVGVERPNTVDAPVAERSATGASDAHAIVIPLRSENPVLSAIRAGQAERLRQAMDYRRTVGDPLEKLSTLLPIPAEAVSALLDDVDESPT